MPLPRLQLPDGMRCFFGAKPLARFTVVIHDLHGAVTEYERTGGSSVDHILEALDSAKPGARISVRAIVDQAAA